MAGPGVRPFFIPCYASGTLIRTAEGDVRVETLRIGDTVATSSGELRRVKWLGHRVVDCRKHSDPRTAYPVRIAVGAFGPNRPSRELFVSPGHSICVDLCGEVMIPADRLINGASIAQVEIAEVTYWHVELDSHDVLIANNLPSESYLAMGNREFFEEGGATLDTLEEGLDKTHADFCRPVVLDGEILGFARYRLLARAESLGWTQSHETDLRLMVDGEARLPLVESDASVFLFPAAAKDVRLVSNTFVPALVGGTDSRALGLRLIGLTFMSSRGQPRAIDLDDVRLRDGLYADEMASGSPWRWTKGDLVLAPGLWEGLGDAIALVVAHDDGSTRRWLAPAPSDCEDLLVPGKPKLYAVG